MKVFTQSIITQLIGSLFMVAESGGSAVEKRKGNKGADKPQHLRDAISKGKEGGELVMTLEQEADQEADEGVKELGNRMQRYGRIFRTWGTTDWPKVEQYPDMLRQAYSKKMGFDMSISVSEWPEHQKFLFRNFVQNQVQPFQVFIDLANLKIKELEDGTKVQDVENGKRVGVGPIIALLEQPVGTFASKVNEARILLGKPARTRKTKGPDQNTDARTDNAAAEMGKTPAVKPLGKAGWDLTDLKKKSPVEACITLVGSMPHPDIMRLVQACASKLKTGDALDKLASERLEQAYKEYLTKSDAGEPVPSKQQQVA